METILPIEIGMPTLRTKIHETTNTEAIAKDLDMAYELREVVAIRMVSYQQRMENLYNKHMKPHAFRAEDLVLRRVFKNTTDLVADKF